MPEGPLRYLLYADTVAVHLALALVLGALASDIWLWRSSSDWSLHMAAKACRTRRVGFALGGVALLLMLALQAAAMSEGSDVPFGLTSWTLLKRTHFGLVWFVGLVGWLLATTAGWSIERWPRMRRDSLLMTLGLAVCVWSRSAMSHAGAHGDMSLDIAVDWAHLALVSLWVGMVFVAAATRLPPASSRNSDGLAAARWVASLSSTATVALAGIVVTGVFKVWGSVPSLHSLWTSDYGLVLVVKVTLVLVAAALGGLNRFAVLPPLLRDLKMPGSASARNWRSHLVNALRLEAVVLLLVVFAAAVLSSTEPSSIG